MRIKNPHASALGKLSGKVWTEAKREASRKNGKKGGRPKKSLTKNTKSDILMSGSS